MECLAGFLAAPEPSEAAPRGARCFSWSHDPLSGAALAPRHGEGAGPQGGPRSPRSQCCTSPSDGAPGAVVGSSSGAAPPFWPRSGSHSPWRLSPSSWPAWCNSSVFPRGASVCPCQACGRTRPEPAPAQPRLRPCLHGSRSRRGGLTTPLRCARQGWTVQPQQGRHCPGDAGDSAFSPWPGGAPSSVTPEARHERHSCDSRGSVSRRAGAAR